MSATSTTRPLRLAMVGGGPGSLIGPVHRMAAKLDNRFELVAGVFSREATRNSEAAAKWDVDPARVYSDYESMLAEEAARDDGAEIVAVVTPNDLHFAVSAAALRAGFHVMCDKPATLSLAEALELRAYVQAAGRLYGLTYTYTGYPVVREAREMIARGDLGAVRKVVVEYSQGWLSNPVERQGSKQAEWRADPARAGVGGCIGDIGVHAFNLAEYLTGHRVVSLLPDVATVVPGRTLDDDSNALLRFEGGARGVLISSQISAGARNGLKISVYGETGGLHWSHERHTELSVDWLEGPSQTLHAGSPYLGSGAKGASRIPSGHPEGFIEAFANIYRDMADAIGGDAEAAARIQGIDEGIRGMAFIETAIFGSRQGAGWTKLAGL